jgi:Flp pilus assembly protein TadD
MLPAALMAYDWLVLDGDRVERRRRFLWLHLPMLALAVTAGLGRIYVLKSVEAPGRPGADGRYALVQLEVVWRYMWLFFAPRGQSIFHAVPLMDSLLSGRAAANVVGFAAAIAVAWRLRRTHTLVTFGFVWFLLLLVPPAVLFTLGRGEVMVERRAYLAGAGLFLGVGYGFGAIWTHTARNRLLAAAAAGVFVVSLGFLTIMRNVVWQDPVRLAREAAELAPGEWLPRVLVGEAFRQSGRCPEAVEEYRAAIDIRPTDEFSYTRMTACLVDMRELNEAERALRRLYAVNPASQDASMGLGMFALLDGRADEARRYFRQTADREPARPRATRLLAFMDRTLPEDDTREVCRELRSIGGDLTRVAACRSAVGHVQ